MRPRPALQDQSKDLSVDAQGQQRGQGCLSRSV